MTGGRPPRRVEGVEGPQNVVQVRERHPAKSAASPFVVEKNLKRKTQKQARKVGVLPFFLHWIHQHYSADNAIIFSQKSDAPNMCGGNLHVALRKTATRGEKKMLNTRI